MLQRKLRRLARTLAISAIATAGVTLAGTKPVLAEFQIQEAGIEKGEVELEYRGAYHWDVPQVTDTNPNANDLLQSHELEFSMGISDWWLIQVTGGFDQPLGENLQSSDVEIESEFALLKREGDGIALSFQAGYEQSINHGVQVDGNPNEFGFGPIVELAKGPFLLTLNPLFTKQIGTFADQEGLGFEYGWRGEYDFTKRWGLGVEMFGEIEDLANAGSFNDQVHSIGPTLFINFGGDNDEAKGGDEDSGKAKAGDDDDKGKVNGPAPTAFSMNVGVQFGLTDATSDTALKFQGSVSF
jgi:hypothetical protein